MRKVSWPLVLLCTIGILSAIMLVKRWDTDTPSLKPSRPKTRPAKPMPTEPLKTELPRKDEPPPPPPVDEPVSPPPPATEEPPPAPVPPPTNAERIEQVEEKLERTVEDFKAKAALLDFGEEEEEE